MALVDFMTEPDKAQSWEQRKEAVVAKLAGATRTEAALVIADKGYKLRDMLRVAATSQASVDSTNRQENLVAGVEARGNLGAGESDLSDRDLAVTRLATRRMENPNPVPGTLAAKRIERHDNAGSKGGSDRHWNRVAACRACNRSKDDTPLETWLAGDTPSGNDINAVATDSTPRPGWPTPAPPATSICRTGAPATPTPASGPEGRIGQGHHRIGPETKGAAPPSNRQALLPVAPSGRLDPQIQPEGIAVLPGTTNRLDKGHRQSPCGTRHGTKPSEQRSAGRRNDRHRTNEWASLHANRWQDQERGRNQARRTRPSRSGRGMGNNGRDRTRMQAQSEGNEAAKDGCDTADSSHRAVCAGRDGRRREHPSRRASGCAKQVKREHE